MTTDKRLREILAGFDAAEDKLVLICEHGLTPREVAILAIRELKAERALSKRLRDTLAACHDALGEIYHGTPLSGDWLVEETGNGAWRDLPDEIRDTLAAYAAVHPEEQG